MTDLTERASVDVAPIDCVDDPVKGAQLLAEAFDAGRRLAVFAPGRTDHAHHVAVEFLHPVVAGTVALPARVVLDGRSEADEVRLVIGAADEIDGARAHLVIPATGEADIMIAYHLLWELVQLALDASPEVDGDSTDFLYPFLDGEATEGTDHLRSSALAKTQESRRLAADSLVANVDPLAEVAVAISNLSSATGSQARCRVLTMGNGGSACDAARAVRQLLTVGVPAQSLADDYAVLSALANDVGAERLFARQVEAVGQPGDLLIGFSTSGASANLLAGFAEAKTRDLVTMGFAGYDGGGFVTHPAIDLAVSVASQSVHRIQEAQAVLFDTVIDRVASKAAS